MLTISVHRPSLSTIPVPRILASEDAVHVDKDHRWHMEILGRVCAQGGQLLLPTENRIVELEAPDSHRAGIEWWDRLTDRGGEGMVVKPLDFVARGKKDIVQPALKCRGLSRKRSLAIREFSLGVEALERFIRREPLRRVHECVFGVLAWESEPVDPRL